jgi:hypothetical protein
MILKLPSNFLPVDTPALSPKSLNIRHRPDGLLYPAQKPMQSALSMQAALHVAVEFARAASFSALV